MNGSRDKIKQTSHGNSTRSLLENPARIAQVAVIKVSRIRQTLNRQGGNLENSLAARRMFDRVFGAEYARISESFGGRASLSRVYKHNV